MSSSSDRRVNQSVRAFAFNPKNPDEVVIVENPPELLITRLSCNTGSDLCNEFELAALRKIVHLYEDYSAAEPGTVVSLAHECRRHVQDCRLAWIEALNTQEDRHADHDLRALGTIQQYMHLLEVIFPLVYEEGTFEQRGYATAEMIRFLREEFVLNPLDNHPRIDEMLDAAQPEHFEGSLYWEYMHGLARQGRLGELYDTLGKHSRIQSPEIDQALLGRFIQVVLVNAPLPGGIAEEEECNIWDQDCTEAIDQFTYWQLQLKEAEESRFFEPLFDLLPQLRYVFDLLQGNFSKIKFSTWTEELCAELLYQSPFLEPRSVPNLMHRLLRDRLGGEGNIPALEQTMLAIMKGDISAGIRLMHDSTGGAALPATITAIYNQVMVGVLSSQESRAAELFADATASILSSLAPKPGVFAAELAVRLLRASIRTGTESEIIFMLCNVLEHTTASADYEVKLLVDLCLPIIEELKVEAVFAPLISLFVERFDYYKQCQRVGEAIIWLIRGRDLERSLGRKVGVCGQKIKVECYQLVSNIFRRFISKEEDTSKETFQSDNLLIENVARALEPYEASASLPPAAILLCRVQRIIQLLREEEVSLRKTGDLVVECLEARPPSSDGGAARPLAPVSMHWSLLKIAQLLMEKLELQRSKSFADLKECVFDADGVTVCLSTLDNLLDLASLDKSPPPATITQTDILDLRKLLAMARCFADVVALGKGESLVEKPSKPLMTVDIVKLPLHEQTEHIRQLVEDEWY